MTKNTSFFIALAIVCGFILPANAQRSFRYRFHYNHTHDTMVYSKARHYQKYKITKTGNNTGIYNDWYKKGGGPLSEIQYEIVNDKIQHRTEKVFTRNRKLETWTVYDTVQPYNIKSFTRTEYFETGKTKLVFSHKNDLLHGHYVEYYANEKTREEGEFYEGYKTGTWKAYDQSGALKTTGKHIDQKTVITCDVARYGHYLLTVTNSFTGKKTSFDIGSLNCRVFDSLDTKYHLMRDGNISFPFTYYHKQGPWYYFSKTGDTTSTEYYVNGELAQPQKMAQFTGGYDSLKAYLKRTIKNPIAPGEPELNGRVYVHFTINSKGEFEHIDVEERWAENVRKEATRIVSQMPLWDPALLNGIPVACNYTLCLVYQPGQNNTPLNAGNLATNLSTDESVQWTRNYGEAVVDGENINEPREEGETVYAYTITAIDGDSKQGGFYSEEYRKTVAKKEGKGMEYVVPVADEMEDVVLPADTEDQSEVNADEIKNVLLKEYLPFHTFYIRDSAGMAALPFVNICIQDTQQNKILYSGKTDANGFVSIAQPIQDTCLITITHTGYKTLNTSFTNLIPNKTTTLVLTPTGITNTAGNTPLIYTDRQAEE
ncbi:MAG TPA: energy transducer TonB [Flavobacteriales bacterium]|nr:energy transducer TonB [Flavobacteriales bacterium]